MVFYRLSLVLLWYYECDLNRSELPHLEGLSRMIVTKLPPLPTSRTFTDPRQLTIRQNPPHSTAMPQDYKFSLVNNGIFQSLSNFSSGLMGERHVTGFAARRSRDIDKRNQRWVDENTLLRVHIFEGITIHSLLPSCMAKRLTLSHKMSHSMKCSF